MVKRIAFLIAIAFLFSIAIEVPGLINYQGKLTNASGQPQQGTFNMVFAIYDDPTGGTQSWTETQTVSTDAQGIFNVLLGSVNPPVVLPEGPNCYLEITVGTTTLSPRQRIVSNGYSYYAQNAENANKLGGIPAVNYAVLPIETNEIQDGAVTSTKILDGTIVAADLNQMGAGLGQVLKWTGSTWAPRNDSIGKGDNAWVRGTPDSVLFTIRRLGIARGGSDNMLYGGYCCTHTNLGVACTTGASGQNYSFCTVGGGLGNTASHYYTTVGGGALNTASYYYATVAGGDSNIASGYIATVGGGYYNTASGYLTTVGGGARNTASNNFSTVGGGHLNTANGYLATVSGGYYDTASGYAATVGGGDHNTASGYYATVGGGWRNTASSYYATVGGGYADTSDGYSSFTTGYHSVVPSSYSNSAAFNGTVATASNQLRCGTLAKNGGTFTIDHPLDPYNKILNHYFIEGPEMLNIYRGSVILDASGRAEVKLPDYFSTLNRNPHIQLTGVGSSDVYVAEDVRGNSFVIGGKPGMKVYWQVTGERQDISAEAIRRLMPVEQEKTGELRGRMLDDDFLVGCMEQLEREGKASGINFRTPAGRKRYEDMKNPPKPGRER